MSQEQSTTARSLRAVSLAITLVTLVAFSTVLYSIYAEYGAAVSVLGDGGPGSGISAKTVIDGTGATLYVNATIPNRGLYPVKVELSCDTLTDGSCMPASVVVPPGGQETLRFGLGVSSEDGVPTAKGNLTLSLVPFASLEIPLNLGSMVAH